MVYGYMTSAFEDRTIWQSKQTRSRGNSRENCVSLLIPKSMDTSKFNGAYVTLRARFVARLSPDVVNLGGCNVTSLELLDPPVIVGK